MLINIQKKNPTGMRDLGEMDPYLWDQFVIGLGNISLQQILQQCVMVHSFLTFQQIQTETVAKNKDDNYGPHAVKYQTTNLEKDCKNTFKGWEEKVKYVKESILSVKEELFQVESKHKWILVHSLTHVLLIQVKLHILFPIQLMRIILEDLKIAQEQIEEDSNVGNV